MPNDKRGVARDRDRSVALLRPDPNQYRQTPPKDEQIVMFAANKQGTPEEVLYEREIVLTNIPLVIAVIRRMNVNARGLTRSELIQEGVIGLIKAIKSYNRNLGSFSNYAEMNVRHEVLRAIATQGFKGRPVFVSATGDDTMRIVAYERRKLCTMLGREPTDDEIAETLRDPKTNHYRPYDGRLRVQAAKRRLNMRSLEFDKPVNPNGTEGRDLKDRIADDHAQPIDILLEATAFLRFCADAFDADQVKEAEVFVRRFGVNGMRETQVEIAADWKKTRQWISQIERRALDHLRDYRNITKDEVEWAAGVLYPNE